MTDLTETILWREMAQVPESLDATLGRLADESAVAEFLMATGGRIIAAGNGAAFYVALMLQLSAAASADAPTIVAIPGGLLDGIAWRPEDRLLVVSSSGELGQAVEFVDRGGVNEFALITAAPESSLGQRAAAVMHVHVTSQASMTHTEGYVGNLAAGHVLLDHLGVVASLTPLADLSDAMDEAIKTAPTWAAQHTEMTVNLDNAVALGTGVAWAAALETALLLKEVTAVPAEGLETSEAATSGMYALTERSLVVSVTPDESTAGAERICAGRGATLLRLPTSPLSGQFPSATSFVWSAALAGQMGLDRGLDIDRPSWAEAYHTATRSHQDE